MVFEALVVGGGINGLSSLYHLLKLGLKRVALVERSKLGHAGASSHGPSRIIRTTYADPDLVRLMRVVREHEWPRLERDLGTTLITSVAGCFFGPPGPFDAYVDAVTTAGADVDVLDTSEARRVFPQFRFGGVPQSVVSDRSAGIVAAGETMNRLAAVCRAAGAQLFEQTPIDTIDWTYDPIRIVSGQKQLLTERLIVAAGPWTGALLSDLRPHLHPRRQTIAYFAAGTASDQKLLDTLPVWAHIAGPPDGISYGLPPFGGSGCKIARHDTTIAGTDDDPNVAQTPAPAALDDLKALAAQILSVGTLRVIDADVCFYTNAENESFALDFLPSCRRVVVAAACSGHAFKFAPLTGRVIAELAVQGRSTVPEFERLRERFSVGTATGC